MPAQAAETFQHYQVLRRPDGTLWELGRGAMGVTYKAFDTNLRSHVCLKVINAAHLDSESARARFLREARAAAGLRHRNVASVYHLGNDDQSFFYAMEFVDGETVETLVKRGGGLNPREALDITLQVTRALGAAHRQGLVHRDIKPANLMVMREDEDEDERLVKVIDFGLARPAASTEGSAHITMGGFVGTPQYSSPEQLQEQDLDTRSDIYSLGITLWFMLVGKPPFTGPLGNVFVQHLTKPPPWDRLGPHAHGPLRTLLARLLAKEPADRPQTPTELRREIEACLRGLAASSASTTLPATLPPARAIRPAPPTEGDTHRPDTAAPPPPPPETVLEASDTPATPAPAAIDPAVPEAEDHPDPLVALTSASAAVEAAPAAPVESAVDAGTVLGGRYRLESMIGEGSVGRVFQARDLRENERIVAVKLLYPGVVEGEEAFRTLETDLQKVRAFPHPALLNVETLEREDNHVFLVEEWVNGFSLVDLLRHRGHLSPREVLRLLESAAAAADHARLHGLHGLQLSPQEVLTHFPGSGPGCGTRDADGEGTRSVVALDLDRWPEFILKLDPLGLTPHAGEFVTWAGDRTLLPGGGRHATAAGTAGTDGGGRRTVSRDTQTSIRGLFTECYLPGFAALAYELLSGTPPPPANAAASPPRLVAVPALREVGNTLLRRCLFSAGETGLESAQEFCAALADAVGLLPALPSARPVVPVPAEAEEAEISPVELVDETSATLVGLEAAPAPVFEESEESEESVATTEPTRFSKEPFAFLAPPPTPAPDLHPPTPPTLPEEDTVAPVPGAVAERLPEAAVEVTESETPTFAPGTSPAASVTETRTPPAAQVVTPADDFAALDEVEAKILARLVLLESMPAAVEEPPAPPPVAGPPVEEEPEEDVMSAASAAATAAPPLQVSPAVEEPEFTALPTRDSLPDADAPDSSRTSVTVAPVDFSSVEEPPPALVEARAAEVVEPAAVIPDPIQEQEPAREPEPEPESLPESVVPPALARDVPWATMEPGHESIEQEPAEVAPLVPVETFSLSEMPPAAPRRVNPLVLAAGGSGAVLLLGVTILAWSSSRAPRPVVNPAASPTPPVAAVSPAASRAPGKPTLTAAGRPAAAPESPAASPEPPASSRNAPPPTVSTPSVVSTSPPSPPADAPPEVTPSMGNMPPPVELVAPPPVATHNPVPEPTAPDVQEPPPRRAPASERSPSAATVAAIEARHRREREQQEQQQVEERREREQAREREASEQRQRERERERDNTKSRSARESSRSEPAPKQRTAPPPRKKPEKAEKPKPAPEEERQRGPAVPFMR